MARTFTGDSSGDRLKAGDFYNSLSLLVVSVWFTAADLTLGSDTDNDIWGLVVKGAAAAAAASIYDWALFADLRTTQNTLSFNVSSGGSHVNVTIPTFTSKISVDTWYNVVAAWDGTNQDIWLSTGDTTNQPSPVGSMGNTAYELAIGGRGDTSANRCWKGKIAECAVYTSGAYPTTATVAPFHRYSPIVARTDGLASYWPIIGRTSPEIDIVGGLDATLVNTPTQISHPPKIIYPWNVKYGMAQEAAALVSILSPAGMSLASRPPFIAKSPAAARVVSEIIHGLRKVLTPRSRL